MERQTRRDDVRFVPPGRMCIAGDYRSDTLVFMARAMYCGQVKASMGRLVAAGVKPEDALWALGQLGVSRIALMKYFRNEHGRLRRPGRSALKTAALDSGMDRAWVEGLFGLLSVSQRDRLGMVKALAGGGHPDPVLVEFFLTGGRPGRVVLGKVMAAHADGLEILEALGRGVPRETAWTEMADMLARRVVAGFQDALPLATKIVMEFKCQPSLLGMGLYKEALPVLEELARTGAEGVRGDVARCLKHRDDGLVILEGLAQDWSPSVRLATAYAAFMREDCLHLRAALLADPDPQTRRLVRDIQIDQPFVYD